VPMGYGFDAKTGREFPCDKDGSEINAEFRKTVRVPPRGSHSFRLKPGQWLNTATGEITDTHPMAKEPTGYGFDAKTGREFPCDKDGSEINAQFRRMAVEFDKLEKDYLAATAGDPDPERRALRAHLMAKEPGRFA